MIYVENMPGADWNAKIDAALQAALNNGTARTIVLPPQRIEIRRPIFCWRHELADNPRRIHQSANIQKVWQVINGPPSARARGLRIVGEGGMSGLVWKGDPFEVMLDVPSPWYLTIRDVNFWGSKTKGVIGLRLRGGWELQSGGGQSCIFERCLFKDLHCGVEVGDPFHAEMSSMEFRMFRFRNCETGMRLLGGKLSQIRLQSHQLNGVEKYGYQVQGYPVRSFRRFAQEKHPAISPVVKDAYGREIFFDRAPEHLKLSRVKNGGKDIAGPHLNSGQPDVLFDGIGELTKTPGGTLFHFDQAPINLMNVRQDGSSKCAVKLGGTSDKHVDQIFGVVTANRRNVIEYQGDGLQQSECVLHGGIETTDPIAQSV